MKKITSVNYSSWAFNLAMLLLRISTGIFLSIQHGYPKLMKFSSMENKFYNFLGLGTTTSLSLVIFAEFFCSMFLILGLFTRITVIPIIITMLVAIFGAAAGKPLLDSELAFLFLIPAVVLLLCGPGKISVDGMINK